MKIYFRYPKGSESWYKLLEMSYVPPKGESISFSVDDDNYDEHVIRTVIHTPNFPKHDAYVVLEVR